jgi:hypothetical protein
LLGVLALGMGATTASAATAHVSGEPFTVFDVSCVSTSFCMAVGVDYGNPTAVAVATRDDGGWHRVDAGTFPDGDTGRLSLLSCASSTSCVALGSGGNAQVLVKWSAIWDGTSWTVTPTHFTKDDRDVDLSGLDCADPTVCLVVGARVLENSGDVVPLAEVWRGPAKGWHRSAPIPPPGEPSSVLATVACTSDTYCLAGGSTGENGSLSLVEIWNGASWSMSADAGHGRVGALSCPVKKFCGAVDAGFVEFRIGKTWSVSPLKHLPYKPYIEDLSCVATQQCILTGYTNSFTVHTPFALRWDGTSWQKMPKPPLPDDGQAVSGDPQAISCVSDTFCVVGGPAYLSSGETRPDPQPLLDLWDGTSWTAEQLP